MKQLITLNINGQDHEVAIEPHWTLLDVVREQLELTGSKQGCDVGDCASCTMLVDGRPQITCIQLAVEGQGKTIRTIEGVAENGVLHPIQEKYNEWGAAQCGYCNPGMILSILHLFDKTLQPSNDEILKALSSNLCRCTGYTKIITAVEEAAKVLREGRPTGSPAPKPAGKR